MLNESNFYLCESCGYTELDDKCFTRSKKGPHRSSSGYGCRNDGEHRLKRYSLGYRFETDVVQLKFLNPDLINWGTSFALVLYDKTPGGENKDSSCYSCLRNYYNQKHHDILKRGHVIKFLNELNL